MMCMRFLHSDFLSCANCTIGNHRLRQPVLWINMATGGHVEGGLIMEPLNAITKLYESTTRMEEILIFVSNDNRALHGK